LDQYEIGVVSGAAAPKTVAGMVTAAVDKKVAEAGAAQASPGWLRIVSPLAIIFFALFVKFYLMATTD